MSIRIQILVVVNCNSVVTNSAVSGTTIGENHVICNIFLNSECVYMCDVLPIINFLIRRRDAEIID